MCNNGLFEEPAAPGWPDESECVEVPVCTDPHDPDPDTARFLPVDAPAEVPDGDYIVYECVDPDALLSDGSGLTAYAVWCDGGDWKTGSPGSLVPLDESAFPTCQSICTDFELGDKYTYITPPAPEDGSPLVVRSGDISEWQCDFGHYIDGSDYTTTR